jgi:hypothetical protein
MKPDNFVLNDLNGELTNFWNVLRDETLFRQFMRIIEATPVSQTLWEEAGRPGESRVDRAVRRTADRQQGQQRRQEGNQDRVSLNELRSAQIMIQVFQIRQVLPCAP